MSSDEGPVHNGTIVSDAEDGNNEILETGREVSENENTEEVQRDETGEGEERTSIKPKRTVRNPQPKLNEETLKGTRGIAALESYFERVRFKGKGCERQDLNVIMKTYEYWCHRLFPKFPFDTCIERLEKLGTKRAVQTHIKRIRFDLLVEDKPIIDSSDEETNNVESFVDIQNDGYSQQKQQFDELLATSVSTVNPEPVILTDEQLERMRLSKERAEKIRQERLRKSRDQAELNSEVLSQVPGPSHVDIEDIDKNRNKTCTEPLFDLESNIKGKAIVYGSSIKKKSTRKEKTNISNADSVENSNSDVDESVQNSCRRNNSNIDRSSDSDEEYAKLRFQENIEATESAKNNENNIEGDKSKQRNITDSNNSNQEMVDNSKGTREGGLMVSSDNGTNESDDGSRIKIKKTKRKVIDISESDEETGTSMAVKSTNSINGKSNSTQNQLSQHYIGKSTVLLNEFNHKYGPHTINREQFELCEKEAGRSLESKKTSKLSAVQADTETNENSSADNIS